MHRNFVGYSDDNFSNKDFGFLIHTGDLIVVYGNRFRWEKQWDMTSFYRKMIYFSKK